MEHVLRGFASENSMSTDLFELFAACEQVDLETLLELVDVVEQVGHE